MPFCDSKGLLPLNAVFVLFIVFLFLHPFSFQVFFISRSLKRMCSFSCLLSDKLNCNTIIKSKGFCRLLMYIYSQFVHYLYKFLNIFRVSCPKTYVEDKPSRKLCLQMTRHLIFLFFLISLICHYVCSLCDILRLVWDKDLCDIAWHIIFNESQKFFLAEDRDNYRKS